MTSLVGILLGLVAAVYLVYVVYLRDLGVRLRWPSLLIFAVIIGGGLFLALAPELIPPNRFVRMVFSYPELAFVLLLCIAWGVGRLFRPYRHCFYETRVGDTR